jgi:signal transduction histidine kinase
MIRRSLKAKLIASYLVIALISVVVIAGFMSLNSSQSLLKLVKDQQATLLNDAASYYYAQTGSWQGFQEYYRSQLVRESNPLGQTAPTPDAAQQAPDGNPPHNFPHEIRGGNGLVDTQYTAIISFQNYQAGQTVPAKLVEAGTPVKVNGETVAWIIPDTDPGFKLNPEEQLYLKRTNQAITLAALVSVAGAVMMGFLLAGVILKPVRNLMNASRKLSQGELNQQVPVHSADELGQLTATFNQMSADLARADQQRRQMTADITHDLSTPLQVIAGYIEMLEDEDIQLSLRQVQIIMTEIDHLRRLVDDLNMLSKADARDLKMDIQSTPPGEIVQQAYGSFEVMCQNQSVQLTQAVQPGLPNIRVDEGRVLQVLRNLLDNALRHTPSGGAIAICADEWNGKVRIAVQDSGAGIHAEDLPYVFDRFYRADKARSGNSGKMGLGLAISKALILAQGGDIFAESEGLGQGARMVILFPPES